jgi:hypothetical protein
MTPYSGDPKISVLHYRLVWKPNFILLLFGLGPDFILPFPAVAEENLGFIVCIFHFLTEKVNFILPFGLGPDFILPFGPGTRFHITVPGFFGSGEYSVICAPPYSNSQGISFNKFSLRVTPKKCEP